MRTNLSFRQLILAGFMLIAILSSCVSMYALWTIERITKQGQEVAQKAIVLTEETQRLTELTISMERSARQYLVLDDPSFQNIFDHALLEATSSLQLLKKNSNDLSMQDMEDWRKESDIVSDIVRKNRPRSKAAMRDEQQDLHAAFLHLAKINDRLSLVCKREIGQSNMMSLNDLEYQRSVLTGVVVAAIVLAMVLALLLGGWLSRPSRQIQAAIERLGENKYDQAVVVGGPADMRRLGQQLDWLRQRLAILEDDKKRFLRHISHELKTPLAALREAVALLNEEVPGKLNDQQHEIVQILGKNTWSLQSQIEDLLLYNAAAFEAQNLLRTKINLFQLLESVVQDQYLQWSARNLDVKIRGDQSVEITVDGDKLKIVFANLLANAIKFSPPHGLIYFAFELVAGAVKIDCVDQGPGVASQDVPHIFDPFYQGSIQPPGARQSNGIGLSIVHEYVTAHGGSIRLLPGASGAHFQMMLNHES